MLDILYIYYEPIPAGQTTHVLSLARGLDRSRYRVTVVLPRGLQPAIADLQQVGATVLPMPLRKLVWPPAAIAGLFRLIRSSAVDIVHVHSQEAGVLARVVARAAGARRLIYTPQVIDIRRSHWHWLYVWVERALARVTNAIVSVNECDRERLIRWGIPPTKVITIPNGVDLEMFDGPADVASLRRALGVDPARPLVMQVGRLSEQKNPLAFVEGAALVIRQRPDAQFLLVGQGPLQDALTERIHALGLQEHVHLAGRRDHAHRLMAAADVVTLTSRWEGLPYALLEAMGWSRPVVATAVNGCPEVVIDSSSGFLTPPGETVAWAGRVLDLLNDPRLAAAMGERGRRRLEADYSLPNTIAQIEELYVRTHNLGHHPCLQRTGHAGRVPAGTGQPDHTT